MQLCDRTQLPRISGFSEQLRRIAARLESGLVERAQAVRLCLLCALAGEHSLLIGPPGTAKSELARRLHTAFAQGRYFERLLTRFTVPEELFGPLSIQALEQDRYERHTQGYLPDANIAFIDEVFKANSAILNALLTLLNEREFDNGAGRQKCPLISLIGATNSLPDDEVTEAFLDRFLLRLPIHPVSDDGFQRLLSDAAQFESFGVDARPSCCADVGTRTPAGPDVGAAKAATPSDDLALTETQLKTLAQAVSQVAVPPAVLQILGELRVQVNQLPLVVSDRRWVKLLRLLKVAAASEGRPSVEVWDLMLLPSFIAPDAQRQATLSEWIGQRLSVHQPVSPQRLVQAVEAFERQLSNEQQANDLDYDAEGRLRFSATELASEIGDAKGGAAALRMHPTRRRRYGDAYILARLEQLESLRLRIQSYLAQGTRLLESFTAYSEHCFWLDPYTQSKVTRHLSQTMSIVQQLTLRATALHEGFQALPRLPQDDGRLPEPVDTDATVQS